MFDSLEETMRHDELEQCTRKERVMRYVAIGAASILFFGGIVIAVRALG